MLPRPIRSNLVAQTVAILTREISSGRFRDALPGEFSLCDSLQISRTTLRAALQIMERQGYLKCRRGLPRMIVKTRPAKVRSASKRPVTLISGRPLSEQTRHTQELLSQVVISLQRLGHECNYVTDQKVSDGVPNAHLERLMLEAPTTLWILISCSAATQRWFYERGLATFVLGHLHPGVRLPACDGDSYSIGHHAATQLLSRGHRQIAMVLPDPQAAGDLRAEAGFAEMMAKAGIGREGFSTLKVNSRRDEIVRLVDSLLARVARPTALFILHVETAICIYSFLVRRGVRVPEDMSIIIGDGGELLDCFAPDFAHYGLDLGVEVKRTCHIIADFAAHGALHSTTHLLMPDFHRGETIAKRSDASA
jgi:LacI family transcriptional regulator